MKYALFLFAALFTISQEIRAEELRFDSCEKIYVHPNQISISEQGIFVYVGNEWLAAESLHADASGVYAGVSADLWTWKCSYSDCGATNSAFSPNKCSSCGRPRLRK